MLNKDSAVYFRQRELAERAAARRAGSDAARRVHQELAQNYAELFHKLTAEAASQLFADGSAGLAD